MNNAERKQNWRKRVDEKWNMNTYKKYFTHFLENVPNYIFLEQYMHIYTISIECTRIF